MQRHLKLGIIALGIAGLLALLWWQRAGHRAPATVAAPATTATEAMIAEDGPNVRPQEEPASASVDGGTAAPAASSPELEPLFPGGVVPALPTTAPQVVLFGVALITHADAEGAPKNARTKAEAKELADKLLEQAKLDFKAAVKAADPGSLEHAGRMPRGVLDPATEYILFTLNKGEVGARVIDTPKGFWIVRRH